MRRVLVAALILTAFRANAADPDARELLRASLNAIANAKSIRVRAQVLTDDTLATGQKLQRGSELTLAIRRPNGFRASVVADRYRRNIFYDGSMVAIDDLDRKLYATFPAPATIDEATRVLREKLGLELPLGHLFASDAPTALQTQVETGVYVGRHRAGGVVCHQLAFTGADVDWQIWIAAEGPPLPRKIVIDYKNKPSRPQYLAILSDWNLTAQFSADEFRFVPASGARKIEFARTGQ